MWDVQNDAGVVLTNMDPQVRRRRRCLLRRPPLLHGPAVPAAACTAGCPSPRCFRSAPTHPRCRPAPLSVQGNIAEAYKREFDRSYNGCVLVACLGLPRSFLVSHSGAAAHTCAADGPLAAAVHARGRLAQPSPAVGMGVHTELVGSPPSLLVMLQMTVHPPPTTYPPTPPTHPHPHPPPCSNKAPVGVYIHAAWLMDPTRAGELGCLAERSLCPFFSQSQYVWLRCAPSPRGWSAMCQLLLLLLLNLHYFLLDPFPACSRDEGVHQLRAGPREHLVRHHERGGRRAVTAPATGAHTCTCARVLPDGARCGRPSACSLMLALCSSSTGQRSPCPPPTNALHAPPSPARRAAHRLGEEACGRHQVPQAPREVGLRGTHRHVVRLGILLRVGGLRQRCAPARCWLACRRRSVVARGLTRATAALRTSVPAGSTPCLAGNFTDTTCSCTCIAEYVPTQASQGVHVHHTRGGGGGGGGAHLLLQRVHWDVLGPVPCPHLPQFSPTNVCPTPSHAPPLPAQAGWCADPTTGACTIPKVWNDANKAFECPGERPSHPPTHPPGGSFLVLPRSSREREKSAQQLVVRHRLARPWHRPPTTSSPAGWLLQRRGLGAAAPGPCFGLTLTATLAAGLPPPLAFLLRSPGAAFA